MRLKCCLFQGVLSRFLLFAGGPFLGLTRPGNPLGLRWQEKKVRAVKNRDFQVPRGVVKLLEVRSRDFHFGKVKIIALQTQECKKKIKSYNRLCGTAKARAIY